MQNVFFSTGFLDKKALEYGLTEDILMENAAAALENEVLRALEEHISSLPPAFCTASALPVLIICGGGNNGGDGWALARRLHGRVLSRGCTAAALVYEAKEPKAAACAAQAERAQKCGVPVYREPEKLAGLLQSCAVLVECLLGSGLAGRPDEKTAALIGTLNAARAKNPACFFLACDIPGGLTATGAVPGNQDGAFIADKTVTMGAYKTALFSDAAKDFTGKISVADLGISRALFEQAAAEDGDSQPRLFLLEESDLRLPVRQKQNVHKGSFGHAAIFSGEKPGAAILAARAAAALGAGLVTIIHTLPVLRLEPFCIPPEIMQGDSLPVGENTLCAGMGFGRENDGADQFFYYAAEKPELPCVIDADLLHHPKLPDLLKKRGSIILTPHPKEFASLLALCGIAPQAPSVPLAVGETAERRLELCAAFCEKFPGAVLLLKGANTLVCQKNRIYINTFGNNSLAKAGSGDMLAGFIVSLLAQGYEPLAAAVNASLIHALAARKAGGTYSLTPDKLLKAAQELEKDKTISPYAHI